MSVSRAPAAGSCFTTLSLYRLEELFAGLWFWRSLSVRRTVWFCDLVDLSAVFNLSTCCNFASVAALMAFFHLIDCSSSSAFLALTSTTEFMILLISQRTVATLWSMDSMLAPICCAAPWRLFIRVLSPETDDGG